MKQINAQPVETLVPLPDSLTVCATVDETGAETEITELMIRRACEQMDADQLWPFASAALGVQVPKVRRCQAKIIPFKRPD